MSMLFVETRGVVMFHWWFENKEGGIEITSGCGGDVRKCVEKDSRGIFDV